MITEQQVETYNANAELIDTTVKFGIMTLQEWREDLALTIDPELDFKDVIELSTKIDHKRTIVHNNYSIASGAHLLQKRLNEHKIANKSIELSKDSVRRTQIALDNECTIALEDDISRLTLAKHILDFWSKQEEILTHKTKLLETIFWALKNQQDKE